MEHIALIIEAIRRTPAGYRQSVLDSRDPFHPNQKGSCWEVGWDMEGLIAALPHHAVAEFTPEGGGFIPRADRPCRYFQVNIPGMLGVIPLASLHPDTRVKILDPKGTCGSPGGGVEAHLNVGGGKVGRVDYSTFILGPSETESGEYILWTAHPGDPAPRYNPVDRPELVGRTVTAAEAIALGLTMVNLR